MIGRRLLLGAPLGILAVAAGGWAVMLNRMRNGEFDPHTLPSQLIGHQVPDFSLPGLSGAGITGADLQKPQQPMLVNFFASWCVPCVQESTVLAEVAKQGLPIWGITYKDKPSATQAFLARQGNPYARIAVDLPGRVAIDWGVYGVPETYFIDGAGIVRWRYAGALTDQVLQRDLLPLWQRAQKPSTS
ncbi:DsbE family thiol:disulfide interchange protein [Acidisoma cladoniae]|jgi:cytochrome c biogenesis protein CcmG/thiol:disulfide interchange protein DsbE|uniref:DsbE family thiol:disulfide interchange protein n=1 Tax=Acidisoma cladoniae TaxID=3040935 RepID=UPI00254A329C|nr:DsbE family thiol:disulfide interchange protein [Acidisoma sp. PAMC 29798]